MNKNRKDLFARTRLADAVPLTTPFKANVDVANACNFKCSFCFHAIDDSQLRTSGFSPAIMDFALFEKIIDQLQSFPRKIRCLGLTGNGEPLLNKRLPDMVALAKNANVADKIVTTSNGSLLNPDVSKALVEAGLDEFIVSVEALNDDAYLDVTQSHVKISDLVENVGYLYRNRGNCKVFAKIVDIACKTKEEVDQFHSMFDGISDMAYLEKIIKQFKSVDYAKLGVNDEQTMYGDNVQGIDVCSLIFYALTISPTGKVYPCCIDHTESVVFGDITMSTLQEIWDGKELTEFRKAHLKGSRSSIPLCRDCKYLRYNVRQEDILDNAASAILGRMERGN